jgi:LmbE family N-acetylglucosaminyl deacetylase
MNILVVAAHPDDEVLGCGGTIAKRIWQGDTVHLLILGEGITSRDNWKQKELDGLHGCIEKANERLGITKDHIFIESFPDNKFDSVSLLDIIKVISGVKEDIKPDIIYTHSLHCLNIDHKRTFEAVVTATRPMQDETVKMIYSFEIPSSTEWMFPLGFQPNIFFDIKETINKKIEAMQEYKDELREYPHPRSLYGIYSNAQLWGMKCGLPFAEAFELVRDIE